MFTLPEIPFVRMARFSYRDHESALVRINYGDRIRWVEPTAENFPDLVREMSQAVDVLISR